MLSDEVKKKYNGITLIALVITIIILLILAGITINSLLGSNGIITRAIEAKRETEINNYYEKIELIREELKMSNDDYKSPTIDQIKEKLDQYSNKNWVASTQKIIDNEIEKLELITKDGYIFYITETQTEYKGKGEVKDTSDLQKSNVIKIEIVSDSSNGKNVKITDLTGKDYYKIKYQISDTKEEWIEIKSGESVEVAYGKTIYAKLYYGPNSGVEYKLSIENEIKYTITYNEIDGIKEELNNPTEYTKRTDTFTLNNPTKEGYTFIGWTGSNGENPETTITIEKGSKFENLTYIANWEEKLDPTIVDYWKLNGSLKNEVKNRENLVIYKGTGLQYLNNSANLVNTILATQNNYTFPSKFTLQFDFYQTSNYLTRTYIFSEITGYLRWNMFMCFGTYSDDGYACLTNGTEGYTTTTNSNAFKLNGWSKYTYMYDGINTYLYRDGNKIMTLSGFKNLNTIFLIGGSIYSGTNAAGCYWGYGNGYYKEIKIYNRTLKTEEISK